MPQRNTAPNCRLMQSRMNDFPREAHTFDYPRYLKALEPVSARAQSDMLYEQFLDALGAHQAVAGRPIRILEIGAGRGTQMQRICADAKERGIPFQYEALEPNDANRAVVSRVASAYSAEGSAITVHPNAFRSFAASLSARQYDAVVARSVLDLMPLPNALSCLHDITHDSWMLYAPLTFGMVTHLAPGLPSQLSDAEHKITNIYHNSILEKTSLEKGDLVSHKIATWGNEQGASVAMKASDWVINPSEEQYKNDEAYALASILGFMYDEAERAGTVGHKRLDAWWNARTRMLRRKRLIYTANQFDLLIRFP